jgi:hypothetical protein
MDRCVGAAAMMPGDDRKDLAVQANKTARIAWKMMLTGEPYRAPSAAAALADAA